MDTLNGNSRPIINNVERQQFQVQIDGEVGYLEYRLSDGMLVLMHTEVPEKLSGRGIGSALAGYAFEYAREKGMSVKIYCPFVLAWLKKHPEQGDIVVKAGN
jgi:predicted GNAT family acetyltransferase